MDLSILSRRLLPSGQTRHFRLKTHTPGVLLRRRFAGGLDPAGQQVVDGSVPGDLRRRFGSHHCADGEHHAVSGPV